MSIQFHLTGVSPLLMHNGAAGIDTRSALSREIAALAAKKAGDRTDVDDHRLQELECRRSLYFGPDGKPTLPEAALRAMIEAAARKGKQGPLVREGLLIERVSFGYDVKRYGETLDELAQTAQFTVPVVVNGKRIARTRARFDCPWSVVGVADVDEELVDREKLTAWLALGGRRIGLGDWRPEKQGGVFGRFDVEEVVELADGAASGPRRDRRAARPGSAAGLGGAERPDGLYPGLSDARVQRGDRDGVRHGMAWRGGALAWLGAAWRGEAGRGRVHRRRSRDESVAIHTTFRKHEGCKVNRYASIHGCRASRDARRRSGWRRLPQRAPGARHGAIRDRPSRS